MNTRARGQYRIQFPRRRILVAYQPFWRQGYLMDAAFVQHLIGKTKNHPPPPFSFPAEFQRVETIVAL
jgi:hypothetical protein